MLLFCHGVMYDTGTVAWWWLMPAAVVAAGFTLSLFSLFREMKGGNR